MFFQSYSLKLSLSPDSINQMHSIILLICRCLLASQLRHHHLCERFQLPMESMWLWHIHSNVSTISCESCDCVLFSAGVEVKEKWNSAIFGPKPLRVCQGRRVSSVDTIKWANIARGCLCSKFGLLRDVSFVRLFVPFCPFHNEEDRLFSTKWELLCARPHRRIRLSLKQHYLELKGLNIDGIIGVNYLALVCCERADVSLKKANI